MENHCVPFHVIEFHFLFSFPQFPVRVRWKSVKAFFQFHTANHDRPFDYLEKIESERKQKYVEQRMIISKARKEVDVCICMEYERLNSSINIYLFLHDKYAYVQTGRPYFAVLLYTLFAIDL